MSQAALRQLNPGRQSLQAYVFTGISDQLTDNGLDSEIEFRNSDGAGSQQSDHLIDSGLNIINCPFGRDKSRKLAFCGFGLIGRKGYYAGIAKSAPNLPTVRR